jgi:phage-related protein
LSDGDAKRVNSIKKLGQAFDDLRSKLVNAKSDIEQVKDIFKSLNEVNTSNIDNVIEKIANKLKVTIDNEGSMTQGDVAAAIRSALDGGTLQQYTFGSGKSERNRFEIDLDGSFQQQ